VSVADIIQALQDPDNEPINWAMGDVLRQRATRDDYQNWAILQHLERGARNLQAWNELFRRTRDALSVPEALPAKARVLLGPDNPSFDLVVDDFIAEMLAAQYLRRLGHEGVRFLEEGEPITADLESVHEGAHYVTEAKNLREPNSLTYVAFARWHRNQAARPDWFNFSVEFVELDEPFEDLTAAQVVAVRELVDNLPNRERPSSFAITMPGNRSLRVRLGEGAAVMLRHGPGPFLVDDAVEQCERAVVLKLMEPTRKGLGQLYSTAVPVDYRRLLFVRWKPPEEIFVIGEAGRVRDKIHEKFQTFIRQFFDRFAMTIAHTAEDLENTPIATWS
jgi:hypothetical protein